MSKYTLLDTKITFSEAEDRYCKLQFFAWDAARNARNDFEGWYVKQGNIYNVLNGFADEAAHIVEQYAIIPLHKTLASDCEIYDLSVQAYSEKCMDLSAAEKIHNEAIDVYQGIEEQQAEEMEYREMRKANRAEFIGGGFGIGGMIAGAAAAGAINMATGAAHSIANSIGNAGSADDANASKAKLYQACRGEMAASIENSILATAFSHIYIVNEYIPDYIALSFDREKSGALLDSAKIVSDKRIQLVVEAFACCPWNYDIYKYVFAEYPDERKNIIEISRDFRVDLSEDISELLKKEYTHAARQSESLAVVAKERILNIMKEIGVSESEVIDEIEHDCLARLCLGYRTADEKTCEDLINRVNAYDALEKNKTPFKEQLQGRIEEIWAKEDGEIFDNFLLKLNVLDPEKVEDGCRYIEEKGRTESAKKYIAAISGFKNRDNIEKARRYRFFAQKGILPILLRWSGVLVAAIGVIAFVSIEEFSFWTQALPIIIGAAGQMYISKMKTIWDKLTINNTVVHPVLTISKEEYEKKKAE